MCMDSSGRLWVAGFFSGPGITCWDPATQDKVEQIDIPAHRVTSCCFGGPNFELLFVTSACTNVAKDEWAKFPHTLVGYLLSKDLEQKDDLQTSSNIVSRLGYRKL